MSAKPENRFIERVHRRLPPLSEFYRERMANPYRSGTPDFWYSDVADLWVEYKFVTLPVRDNSHIDFDVSALQRRWIEHRRSEGRDVWLIVGCKAGARIFRDYFDDGMVKEHFMRRIQTVEAVAEALLSFCQCQIGGQQCNTEQGVSRI